MTPKFVNRAAASVGIAALVASGVLLGAAPAQAGSPLNSCGVTDSIGTEVAIVTPGAWWYDVCVNTTVIGEAETTNKTDAFDGFGYIYIDGLSDPVAAVPTSAGYVGADYVVEFTDLGYDLGGGDLVDAVVTQTFSGTFVQWTVDFFDAGTTTPRNDVVFTIEGNLGCDSSCVFETAGNEMLTGGDSNDPYILWQVDGASSSFEAPSDSVTVHAQGAVVLTVALADFGCTEYEMDYIYGVLEDGLTSHFGESLQIPGTEDCITVGGPLELTTGQTFSYEVPFVFGSWWNFSTDGDTYLDNGQLEWTDYDSLGGDGDDPGMRLFGTAPTSPGTYILPVYVGDGAGLYTRGFLTIIVSEPKLAATGLDVSAPLAAGLGAMLLGATALLVVRRRRATEH